MQYIKHYYVDEERNVFCCETTSPAKYKIHPWRQYEGLDVKVWLSDSDGVDSMLAELPDTTPVSDIIDPDCGKKSIQVLTQAEFDGVYVPYSESQVLFTEAMDARQNQDLDLAAEKESQGQLKLEEALVAFRAL